MLKKILIATNNAGKYEEISGLLKKEGIETISPADLGIDIDVEETGKTLEENASLKAIAIQKLAPDYLVLADDTGLEIKAINNEPGIYVRRWKDKETHMTDEEILNFCLERMKNVPKGKRGAHFRTVVALALPYGNIEFFSGTTEGEILEKPEDFRVKGLPFECLFYVTKLNAVLGKAKQIKDAAYTTHRAKAVLKAVTRIKELLGN